MNGVEDVVARTVNGSRSVLANQAPAIRNRSHSTTPPLTLSSGTEDPPGPFCSNQRFSHPASSGYERFDVADLNARLIWKATAGINSKIAA
jgi:hypothetical protein